MSDKLKSKKLYSIYAVVLSLAIVTFAMIYVGLINGDKAYINGDLLKQCAPISKMFFNKLLDGSDMNYSFQMGLGTNMVLNFSFISRSLFNVVYLFISDINTAVIVIFLLKIGFTSFIFSKFLSYNLGVNSFWNIIFSVYYSLISYVFVIMNMNSLHDAVYFLPLIFIIIKYFIRTNKLSILAIAYAILFMTHFYVGFLVGVASFVYFVIYLFLNNKLKAKNFFYYFGAVITAFLCAAVVILPTISIVINSNAIDSQYNFTYINFWTFLHYLFPFNNIALYELTPYIACGIPSLIFLVHFFIKNNIDKKLKIIVAVTLAILVSCIFIKPFYIFVHMFNDPTGYTCRFVYLISFIIISVAAFSTKYLNDEDEKKFNITGLIVGLVNVFAGALEIVFSEVNIYLIISVVLSLVFICVWTVLISKSVNLDAVQKQDKSVDIDKRYLFIFILCFLELGINSYICLNSQLYVDIDQYKYRAQTAKQIISDIKESDNGIYRIHYEPTANQNNATLYGYKGATIFSSSNQQNLKNFLFKIGLSCTDFEISDMGDTDLVKFLLGEKYIVHAALMDGADSNIDIQQNSTYAGLAFMTEMDDLHYINNIDLNNNIFENQNNIIKALGSEKPMFYSFDDNLDIDAENIEYGYDNDRLFFKKTEPYKEGYIIFSMPYLDGYDAYCYFNQGHNYISPTSPFVLSEKDNIICGYENSVLSAPHIVQMSLDDNNNYSVYLYFSNTSDEIVYIDEMLFYYYDKTVLPDLAAGITPVQIIGMEDGKVDAAVTIDKTQLAYFSIPYEEGWSAYVDGESVSIVPVFENAFIGMELDEGTHEIELCFEAPMAKEGKIVSIVGIFALILLIILDILSNYKKKTDVV